MSAVLPPWASRSPVARLATVDGSQPHLVPVVFVEAAGAIYIPLNGKPKSGAPLKRVRNIESNPLVSLLIDDYFEDWSKLRWTRIDGDARIVATPASAVAALRAKYPQYGRIDVGTTAIRVVVARKRVWSARPGAESGIAKNRNASKQSERR